jgi:thiosulfate reductase cytochrome b subunit
MNHQDERIYLYPVWIRLWHVLNALLCLTLIITGLSIQYSTPTVTVKFKLAVSIHNIAGVALALNYIIFFIGNLFTSNGAYYLIEVKGFMTRLMIQFRYYTYGLFKKENPPFPVTKDCKFNPLQQSSYVAAMYILVPLSILSGFLLLYPEIPVKDFLGISGFDWTDLIHLFVGFFITIFMCIHIYFCTIGKTPKSNFKSIINGYHESH